MDFNDRLKNAIDRGQKRQEARQKDAAAAAMSEAEIKQLHTKYRLQLSEQIETGLKRLADHFPGFRLETLYGDRGWGAAATRDDLKITRGVKREEFSRLEITVRPFSALQVLELQSRGTIHNREVFNRHYFDKLPDVDAAEYQRLIDNWILEYAELFAAAV
jgi:hypothetical protein